MSKRLEELYTKYLAIKKLSKDDFVEKKGDYKMFLENLENIKFNESDTVQPEYEIGELFLVDDFLFLLVGEVDDFYTGYKVSEWVDFATHKDFIFEYEGDKYFAILEHELYIPKNKVAHYIGTISDKYIDVLYEHESTGEPIPDSYTGLTIPYDPSYPQIKFRQEEMKEVRHYIANQFLIFEEESNILDLKSFKQKFVDKLKKLNYPKAASSATSTAQGENFILKYDKAKGILTILLPIESKDTGIIKVIIEDDEFLCKVEEDVINFDILEDFINIDYLVGRIKIILLND